MSGSDDSQLRRFERAVALAVLVEISIFGVLIALAMRAYPGGTAWDSTSQGHDFWRNYLCDLERRTALDGRTNAQAALFARVAMVVLGAGSFVFWWLLQRLFPARAALGRAAIALGSVSAAGTVAVGLLPADRFPSLHPVVALVVGGPGIAAAVTGVIGLSGGGRRPLLAIWGASGILVSGVDLALYFCQVLWAVPTPLAVPVLERLALLLALSWQALVAVSAVRGAKGEPPAG